jgi:hypothetical protein
VSRVGIEPTTSGLKVRCSTPELPARSHYSLNQTISQTEKLRSGHTVVVKRPAIFEFEPCDF